MENTILDEHLVRRASTNIVLVEPQPLLFEGFKSVFRSSKTSDSSFINSGQLSDLSDFDPSKFYFVNFESLTQHELEKVLKEFKVKKIKHLLYSTRDNQRIISMAYIALENSAESIVIGVTPDKLAVALDSVLSGKAYYCSQTNALRENTNFQKSLKNTTKGLLTQREFQVLKNLANGYSNKDVAKALEISVRTVETHRSRIMSKLKAKSFADLVRYALENQIV